MYIVTVESSTNFIFCRSTCDSADSLQLLYLYHRSKDHICHWLIIRFCCASNFSTRTKKRCKRGFLLWMKPVGCTTVASCLRDWRQKYDRDRYGPEACLCVALVCPALCRSDSISNLQVFWSCYGAAQYVHEWNWNDTRPVSKTDIF